MVTRTALQRLVDGGEIAFPAERPSGVDEHAWRLLVRHVRDGVPYAALAREAGVSLQAVRQALARLVERLRHPDLLHVPPPLWRALVGAGYTTWSAIAAAPDAALLALAGVDHDALWRLRQGLYNAPRDRADRQAFYRQGRRDRRRRRRPRPLPQPRGDLPRLGELVADDDGSRLQCHVCGHFYAGLSLHARGAHGLSPAEYRERYGLARGQSLYAPAYQAKQRAAALGRDQGAVGRATLREVGVPGRRPGRDTRLSSRIASSRNRRRRAGDDG